jgi:hypothetical protein
MTARKVILTPELVEEARLVYEAGAEPVEKAAEMLGMGQTAFYRFIRAQGWRLRRQPIDINADFGTASRRARPAQTQPPVPVTPLTTDEMIPKLEAAIAREFAHAEHALAHGEPRNAEKTAKTMASLVRSLAELKRVKRDAQGHGTQNEGAGEPPARDLAELKAELARRLDRLRHARDAEQGS